MRADLHSLLQDPNLPAPRNRSLPQATQNVLPTSLPSVSELLSRQASSPTPHKSYPSFNWGHTPATVQPAASASASLSTTAAAAPAQDVSPKALPSSWKAVNHTLQDPSSASPSFRTEHRDHSNHSNHSNHSAPPPPQDQQFQFHTHSLPKPVRISASNHRQGSHAVHPDPSIKHQRQDSTLSRSRPRSASWVDSPSSAKPPGVVPVLLAAYPEPARDHSSGLESSASPATPPTPPSPTPSPTLIASGELPTVYPAPRTIRHDSTHAVHDPRLPCASASQPLPVASQQHHHSAHAPILSSEETDHKSESGPMRSSTSPFSGAPSLSTRMPQSSLEGSASNMPPPQSASNGSCGPAAVEPLQPTATATATMYANRREPPGRRCLSCDAVYTNPFRNTSLDSSQIRQSTNLNDMANQADLLQMRIREFGRDAEADYHNWARGHQVAPDQSSGMAPCSASAPDGPSSSSKRKSENAPAEGQMSKIRKFAADSSPSPKCEITPPPDYYTVTLVTGELLSTRSESIARILHGNAPETRRERPPNNEYNMWAESSERIRFPRTGLRDRLVTGRPGSEPGQPSNSTSPETSE